MLRGMDVWNVLVAICAVIGAALGIWNFWFTHWGSRPRRAISVEHLEGPTFVLGNAGRRTLLIESLSLIGTESSITPNPGLLRLGRGERHRFEVMLMDEWPAPTGVKVKLADRAQVLTAPVPWTPVARGRE